VTGPRILLAKPGLDGHDRGLKVIAFALRDAGAEVIYLGLRQSPAAIVAAAVAEDADLIGISVLSGAHLPLAGQILARRAEQGAGHIPVVMGGTIPAAHADQLREMGVAAVYPAGSLLPEVVDGLLSIAEGSGPSGSGVSPGSTVAARISTAGQRAAT
jgi:methylmalonyl-CoA mutase, C-terminal domain